jgi:predicted 2-oxoglutarate/Fe(II)-dependent dioxygenase YbiX
MAQKNLLAGEAVFTLDNLLTPDECAAYIARSEGIGYDAATISTGFGQERVADVRNNDRVILDEAAVSEALWPRVQPYLPRELERRTLEGLNERWRFYRYDPGQRFDWHLDGYYQRENGSRSLLTLLFFLNDDFEGGETRFRFSDGANMQEFAVKPVRGMALVFRHAIWHEGSAVTRGRKYVLRTDVMYSPPGRR